MSAIRNGFTLLELLVVMVIIGLLASYVGPRYFAQIGKSEVKTARLQVESLSKALDQQKSRKSRIPQVDPGRFAKLPPPARAQAEKIVWMNVSMGYQPQLTVAWFDCLRAFQSEASFDRVFSNSVFWVVTRSNECFY